MQRIPLMKVIEVVKTFPVLALGMAFNYVCWKSGINIPDEPQGEELIWLNDG